MQGSYKLQNATAFLIDKRVGSQRKTEIIAKAMELRKQGAIATVLPMAKNVGNQIKLLENEGYTTFEKVYE